MNDGRCLIFDELSMIKQEILSDLTDCRSSGVIDVTTISGSKKAPARVAKIMLSNARSWTGDKAPSFGSGMSFLKNLCFKDEILSRFDIAWIVKAGDINYEKLPSLLSNLEPKTFEEKIRKLYKHPLLEIIPGEKVFIKVDAKEYIRKLEQVLEKINYPDLEKLKDLLESDGLWFLD